MLQTAPEDPAAWNGVGLVLSELRKFEDARNAFARAIQAKPEYAEAHYNLSFTLSNLGDFEGALRETKRALELDPYYVAQKFELAIDLEYEDPDLSIQPDLGAVRADRGERRGLHLRPGRARLAVHRAGPGADAGGGRRRAGSGRDAFAMASDYLGMGLYDRAAAEVSRALRARRAARGRATRCSATSTPGRGCTARRSSGIARRSAREPDAPRARLRRGVGAAGDVGRGRDALPIAEALVVAGRPSTSRR